MSHESPRPRVSVVIPVFNAEQFLKEAVESALGQTYPNIEVIVVDDGSTDNTPHVLETFSESVRVVRTANGGVARARNVGAALATGDWIAFLDADDVWLPTKVEEQMSVATVPLVYTDRFNIGELGILPVIQSDVNPLKDGDIFVPLLARGNFITMSSVLVRGDVFKEAGGFFEPLSAAADWDLWIRIAERHTAVVCRRPLLRYRIHGGAMSRNHRGMAAERQLVVDRALSLPRARAFGPVLQRQIRSRALLTSGWDAAQAGAKRDAAIEYGKALLQWPFDRELVKEVLRLLVPQNQSAPAGHR